MSEKDDEKKDAAGDTGSENTPFVNEECGDTMWDIVIKEAEERLKGVVGLKGSGTWGKQTLYKHQPNSKL